MTTLPPAWRAAISTVPTRGLPAATRSSGCSRPWSSALRTRCTSGSPSASTTVRSSSVSLPDELQLDLLAELARQVADEAREAQEDDVDRDHPDLHDHRLERLAELRVRSWTACWSSGTSSAGGQRLDRGAVDHELAHRVHQRIEPLGVDADGSLLVVGAARRGLGLLGAPSAWRSPRPRPARRPTRPRGPAPCPALTLQSWPASGRLRCRRSARSTAVTSTSATSLTVTTWFAISASPICVTSHARIALPCKALDRRLVRHAANEFAVLGERGQNHQRAHGGHQRIVGELHLDVEHDSCRRRELRRAAQPAARRRRGRPRERLVAPPVRARGALPHGGPRRSGAPRRPPHPSRGALPGAGPRCRSARAPAGAP